MSGRQNRRFKTYHYLIINCLIILLGNSVYSQSVISGTVKDSIGNTISYATIVLQPVNSPIVMDYATSDEDGVYKLTVKEKGSFDLHFSAMSYSAAVYNVDIEPKTNVLVNAILKEERLELDEVIIENEKPITIKKDTIIFDVKSFLQGNEKVVEDLLKKIPGITVTVDGTIKIGGQEVEKIMIDNDDFFEKGYKILTKNMPVNPIDKIELYQNYSNNKHLKGVENSEKVALNLKLKDNFKREWFGNVELGYGVVSENRYEMKSNLMNFGKKNKFYFLNNFNNIGFDATGDINHLIRPASTDGISNIGDDQSAVAIIELDSEKPNLNEQRVNFNNAEMISLNSIFTLSSKIKLKTLGFFNADENLFYKNSFQAFQVANVLFENYENYTGKNIQKTGFIKMDLTYDLSKSKTLIYTGKINATNKDNISDLAFNNNPIHQRLNNKNHLSDHKIVLTNKYKENSAILFTLRYIVEKMPQIYDVDKFIYEDLFPGIQGNNIAQTSSNKMNYFGFETHIIRRGTKNDLFEVKIGDQYRKDIITSLFLIKDENSIVSNPQEYQNSTNYITNDAYLKVKYGFKFKKVRFDIEGEAHQFENKLNNAFNESNFFINPKFGLTWEINQNNRVSASYSFNKTNAKIVNVYSNYINTGFRTFSKGTGTINFLNSSSSNLSYTYGNWGDKFFAYTNIGYNRNYDFISTNSLLAQNYSQSEKIIIKDRDLIIVSSNIDRYFAPILSNLKLNFGGTKSNFKNIVNGSGLRNVINTSVYYGFEIRSSFKDFINFSLGSRWDYNKVKTILESSYKVNNTFADVNIAVNKKINVQLKTERYLNSNLDKNSNKYYFIDFGANYNPNKSKLSFSIIGNNLLNNETFKNYFIDDVSISKTEFRLQPRYILLKIEYRF